MNKEDKNSHVLPFRLWVVFFSPYLCCTPQGMCKKNGKFCVIFDRLTQSHCNEVVLNHITTSDFEATIDFGQSKVNFLSHIYN